MCGRYALINPEEVPGRFNATGDALADPEGRYNIAPGSFVPVIIQQQEGRVAVTMRWGLVPSWAKDPRIGFKMINARAETLHLKPSFKALLHNRRCIMPASGFYEWQKQNNAKQPHYIHPTDGQILAFAGLYDVWCDAEGKELYSCTIITVPANQEMIPIHHRMPAILDSEGVRTWLSPDLTNLEALQDLLRPFSADMLNIRPISTRINSARVDDETLIQPTPDEGLE